MTKHGKEVLAEQLSKFKEIPGFLTEDVQNRLLANNSVIDFLLSAEFIIHKHCYDSFNDQKYDRAVRRKRSSGSDNEINPAPMKTRLQ